MKSFIKKKISLSDTYCSLVQHSLVALGTSCWKYVHKYVPCSTEQLVNLAILSNLLWKVCLSFDSPNVGQKLRVTFLANFTNWHFPTGFNCLFTRTRTAVLLPPHSISFFARFFFLFLMGQDYWFSVFLMYNLKEESITLRKYYSVILTVCKLGASIIKGMVLVQICSAFNLKRITKVDKCYLSPS